MGGENIGNFGRNQNQNSTNKNNNYKLKWTFTQRIKRNDWQWLAYQASSIYRKYSFLPVHPTRTRAYKNTSIHDHSTTQLTRIFNSFETYSLALKLALEDSVLIRSSVVGHKEFSAFEGFPPSPPLFLFLGFAASKASLFSSSPSPTPPQRDAFKAGYNIYCCSWWFYLHNRQRCYLTAGCDEPLYNEHSNIPEEFFWNR